MELAHWSQTMRQTTKMQKTLPPGRRQAVAAPLSAAAGMPMTACFPQKKPTKQV